MAIGTITENEGGHALRHSSRPPSEAGTAEGIVLVMACWCTVLASGLLSPVLPQIAQAFGELDDVEMLVGLVATMPALVVALLAVPSGRLADRIGQRRVLLAGLLFYGIAGVIPFWLQDIYHVIAARAVVGVGEAAVMTASTALISLRFSGERRTRWLAAQVAAANTLGIFVLLLGGQLGLLDWRVPFLAYGFGIFLLVLSIAVIRQPASERRAHTAMHEKVVSSGLTRHVALFCLLNIAAVFALFVIIVQMAFLMPERGAQDSADIGLAIAAGATGVAIGSAIAGPLAVRLDWWRSAALGFLLVGSGYIALAATVQFWTSAACVSVSGLGIGLIIPALLSALVRGVPAGSMGQVIGFWTAATFIGQFLNPPVFSGLQVIFATRANAIGVTGIACVAISLCLAIAGRRYIFPGIAPDNLQETRS